VFGLGLMGFGVSWLHNSIAQFGGVGPIAAIAITALFIAVVSLYFALFAGIYHTLSRYLSTRAALLGLAPLVWVSVEALRSWLFTGFPWLVIGYSQTDLPLAGYAPIVGVLGISWLVALSAGLLHDWRNGWSWAGQVIIWGLGALLTQHTWTQPTGEPFQASLIQGNIAQQHKWQPSWYQETIQRYRRLTEQAADSELVIWPETAIPAYNTQVEISLLQPLHAMLQAQQRDLLTGIVVKEAGRYYNAMISLGQSGRQAYYKRHLVPFGEYLPGKTWLQPILDFIQIPMSDFSAGTSDKPVLRLAGQLAGVDICYEDAFASEVVRALPEAGYLINASNDAWFGDSLAPHQHLQIARMRAQETERYLLRATNTGISAIINAKGQIQQQAAQFATATVTGTVQARQGATPYVAWGDWNLLLFALISCIGILLTNTRRRRNP
jgi:apolipoprotein N-acyltransferase